VPVACGLLIGSLDLWCHIVAEVVGGFYRPVPGGITDVGVRYAVPVGKVDWRCFGGAAIRTMYWSSSSLALSLFI
jgi:hypothetical protein